MNFNIILPKKALNKAFLKVKPNRNEIENFKTNFIELLDKINDTETEEFHKNLLSSFLKKTYYDPTFFINTKGKNDLVIHNDQFPSSFVGVLFEVKKPTNRTEMVTKEKLNVKAFHELILYYLRERITHRNLELKHLIITNIWEWFIFDAISLEKLLIENKTLVQHFKDFESGRLGNTKTDFFYKEIIEPLLATIEDKINCTYFNLKDYQKIIKNQSKLGDNKLVALFKLLSPEHLLKLPYANDSNSLNKNFYNELLYIIGLTETKEDNKKVITRNKPGERHAGTILENIIVQLTSLDKISRLNNPEQFGNTQQERLFNVAIELTITWLNRILFLKLLEAQLISYHKGDRSYSFLNIDKIKNYDDLNALFFQVLAKKTDERTPEIQQIFPKIPYLNSSLFEPSDIEHSTIFISNLKDNLDIPVYRQTGLKDTQGKKLQGTISTLEYLFEFLNSYDFSTEGSETIQEENKTLINASVLGLIFEKINGYKDGSFFTPGFITMYMCRDTIRKAVIQKFNDIKGWNCNNINQLYNLIENRQEANEIINSITICDPAAGSGHFLVSALNEIIALKNDLKILQDRQGNRLKEYHIEVINDELIVTDEDGDFFQYNPHNKESQRIQETLFHEKRTIIENCLFGVDINPNSVKICRLRLWIELLKNAYYKNIEDLETLPNIDINIKCGNSIISRFPLNADLSPILKKNKWTIARYKEVVATYRNAKNKEQKKEMENLIMNIKSDFRSEISMRDPHVIKLRKLSGELFFLNNQFHLFDTTKKEQVNTNKKIHKLTIKVNSLKTQIDKIKENRIYKNAFEWRFEFPEVLNENGDFHGFDVIIGNPPYGVKLSDIERKYFKSNLYNTGETAILFIKKGHDLLTDHGKQSYIIPKAFAFASNYAEIREMLKNELSLIIDCHKPWQDVKLEACIFQIEKGKNIPDYNSQVVKETHFVQLTKTPKRLIDDFGFIPNGITNAEIRLAQKIKTNNLLFSNISQNKRGVGLQKQLLTEGNYPVIGGIDLQRGSIKEFSQRGFINDIASIEEHGKIHNNSILVQNIVAHLTNPVGHIKIIAALPPILANRYILLDTINQFTFNENISNIFGCALLNSKLINWYVYNFIYAKAIRTMHFDNVVTDRIPFPQKYFESRQMIDSLGNNLNDQHIYELYNLDEAEISLIESTF